MKEVIIATFILSTLAIIAGCMKASSADNNKDFQTWQEEVRRYKDGK